MPQSTLTITERKRVFRNNLRHLTGWVGMSLKEVAYESGLGEEGYRWLRRVASKGVHGHTERNRVWLRKLTRFFGSRFHFGDMKEFWNPDLAKQVVGRELNEAGGLELSNARVVEMLEELLEMSEYRYLKAMIADLYRLSGVGDLRRAPEEIVVEWQRKPR